MAKEILIVEDEGFIASLLSKSLSRKGYDIAVLDRQALSRARKPRASLVILEAPSAVVEAWETCRFLRETTAAPIIALTEHPAELDSMEGVECLTKPVDFRQLLAAVEKALTPLRRGKKRPVRFLRCGNLSLDLRTQCLTKGDQRYRLTPKEFLLLKMFMSKPGQVLTHKAIMKEVWYTDYLGDRRTLYVHVNWIRQKIEDAPGNPVSLRTVRGVGYRFEVAP